MCAGLCLYTVALQRVLPVETVSRESDVALCFGVSPGAVALHRGLQVEIVDRKFAPTWLCCSRQGNTSVCPCVLTYPYIRSQFSESYKCSIGGLSQGLLDSSDHRPGCSALRPSNGVTSNPFMDDRTPRIWRARCCSGIHRMSAGMGRQTKSNSCVL